MNELNADIRREGMRIGGEVAFADDSAPLEYLYSEEVVGKDCASH